MATTPEHTTFDAGDTPVQRLQPSLRIVELQAEDRGPWERFVNSHPDGLIYHHPHWLQGLSDEFKRDSVVLGCIDEFENLQGVLPLMFTRGTPLGIGGPSLGKRLASLPRTPVAGPLATNDAAHALLIRAALKLAEAEDARLQVKTSQEQPGYAEEGLTAQPWKELYVLHLPPSVEQLRFGNATARHRIRWAVKKAENMEVSVHPAVREAELHSWYRLYLETMRWHGTPPRPYRFFVSLWRSLYSRGMLELLLAERSGRLLAGYLLLKCSSTVHCYLNGRCREQWGFHANDILQWRAIHDACAAGYQRYDFGEVEEGQQGLIDFKLKWGAKPARAFRYYSPAANNSELRTLAATCLQSRRARLWRRLPLWATARIGESVYSYL